MLEGLDARLEKPEINQLSMYMPPESVERFADWFYSGEGREVLPLRELAEELVDEMGVFPDRNFSFRLTDRAVVRKFTEKAGGGDKTHYFFDLSRLDVSGGDGYFRAAAMKPSGLVRLVTRDETIARCLSRPGMLDDGAEVGDMFRVFGWPGENIVDLAKEYGMTARLLPSSADYEASCLPDAK